MTRTFLAVVVALASLATMAPAANADFGFVPGSAKIEALRPGGQPDLRAGGHPDRLKINFDLNTAEEKVEGNTREFSIELPPGLLADGSAVPACPRSEFDGEGCPPESQVGVLTLKFANGEKEALHVSNVEPPPGGSIELGARFFAKLPMTTHLRPGDGGVTIDQADLSQAIAMAGVEFELWGVPADHQTETGETGLTRRPFLTLPTNCAAEGLSVTLRARSWQQPAVWQQEHASTGVPLEGCDLTPFDPGIGLRLANPLADAPTGTEFDLNASPGDDPDGRGAPPIKDVSVELPAGMSMSPGGAQSLEACGDAGFDIGAESPPACPPGSKAGTVEIVSPALKDPAAGTIYVGEEHPGERFRLLIAARAADVQLKLAGALRPDPETGQLTFALHDLPRIPLSRMTLRFNGGSRALLVTPLGCGAATATATFAAYDSNATAAAQAQAAIAGAGGAACGGALPFAPTFSAGAPTPLAGRDTALSMTLRRHEGEQLAERFGVELPAGLATHLGTVETCGAAGAASGDCPAGSRIGSAVAEIGSGPVPAELSGDVYLTGPRRGAPYGLALAFDSKLGPFDLGSLVVRGTIRVGLLDGRIAIETDPLPRIIAGVPIRLQTIGLDIDRPGFVSSPTSCRPSSFEAGVRAVDGRVSVTKVPFEVRDCESQPFHPSLSLGILGNRLDKGDAVGFRIGVRMPSRTTNLRGMSVPLPAQLQFDPTRLEEVCARGAVLKGRCPSGSQVGAASARTPLLSKPLQGSVYVVQPPGKGLPDLWTILRGEGLKLAIRTTISSRHGRTVADLAGIPDFPLSDLRMSLASSGSGLISLQKGLCEGGRGLVPASTVGLEGQDRAYSRRRVPVAHRACGGKRRKRAKHRGSAGRIDAKA